MVLPGGSNGSSTMRQRTVAAAASREGAADKHRGHAKEAAQGTDCWTIYHTLLLFLVVAAVAVALVLRDESLAARMRTP